jgi:uncharacterized membrane protein (DUF373 family)
VAMTGLPAPGDENRPAPGEPGRAAPPPEPGRTAPPEPGRATPPEQGTRARGVATTRQWIWAIEHAQDVVTVTVGVVLIALAVVLLVSGITDFANESLGRVGVSAAATHLVDNVLFVLILVEIVYTVVLSLRAHRLVAQPFIVVGLIAVIRRILLVLTPGTGVSASTSELALLIAMVAVFVAGLIAVSIFEKGGEKAGS